MSMVNHHAAWTRDEHEDPALGVHNSSPRAAMRMAECERPAKAVRKTGCLHEAAGGAHWSSRRMDCLGIAKFSGTWPCGRAGPG